MNFKVKFQPNLAILYQYFLINNGYSWGGSRKEKTFLNLNNRNVYGFIFLSDRNHDKQLYTCSESTFAIYDAVLVDLEGFLKVFGIGQESKKLATHIDNEDNYWICVGDIYLVFQVDRWIETIFDNEITELKELKLSNELLHF